MDRKKYHTNFLCLMTTNQVFFLYIFRVHSVEHGENRSFRPLYLHNRVNKSTSGFRLEFFNSLCARARDSHLAWFGIVGRVRFSTGREQEE